MNAKKSHKAKLRLEGHLGVFGLLWDAAVVIMHEAKLYEALTAFEWPTFCMYWQKGDVWEHMVKMGYEFIHFHGCMFGLESVAPSTKGWPIKKPWTVATDCPTLRQFLQRRCLSGYWHTDIMYDPE